LLVLLGAFFSGFRPDTFGVFAAFPGAAFAVTVVARLVVFFLAMACPKRPQNSYYKEHIGWLRPKLAQKGLIGG